MTQPRDSGPERLGRCPQCRTSDHVKGVPAVFHAGTATTLRQADGTEMMTTGYLHQALSPVPLSRPVLDAVFGVLALLVAIGTFIGGAGGGHWFSGPPKPAPTGSWDPWLPLDGTPAPPHHPSYAFLGWISGIALAAALALITLAILRRARFLQLVREGRPGAERVWSQGRYCTRCGVIHFPPGRGLPTQPLGLQEFRTIVWHAGGYGHLAHRLPLP